MSFDTQSWTDPGPEQVAPGVHRVPLPMPNDGLRAVNVYVIEDDDGLVLIDSGWEVDEAVTQLAEALAVLGYRLADVRRFLITHMHRDHYTLAVALRRQFGMPITLGAGERASLETILGDPANRTLGELRRWGFDGDLSMVNAGVDPRRSQEIYGLPDDWITGVTDIAIGSRTLRAVPTPGHTNGHTVFVDAAASLLFAGDHVLPHITPSIGLQPVIVRSALSDFLDSLRALLDYPDMLLLPAHGPVVDSSHTRIKELLAHHDERLARTLHEVRSGARTAYEVASKLGWTRRERAFSELNEFNQFLAVGETAAHLDHLVAGGALTEVAEHDVARYQPAC